jgi:uncharacterized membrane protein
MRQSVRRVLAALFMIDGVLHVVFPAPFLAIVPPWVPVPAAMVFLTGLAAFAGGAGLLVPRLRRYAGVGLALYCVAVFPANIHHAMTDIGGWGLPYHAIRLPLQPLIIWTCLWAGEVIDWPFASRR